MARLKAAQRREQLIDVATKLFAKSGYDATTTADIAKAAGVTEPILYRHFASKQELFVAIVRSVSALTMKGWNDLAEGSEDPAEKLRRVCDSMPEHIKKLGDAYHVLHGALSTSQDKKVKTVMKEHYRQIEAFFGKIVADGQKTGIFNKSMTPQSAAWQFIITGIGYAMVSLNLGTLDKAMAKEVIEAILRGLKN
jgi:AcrR family transcriptional regulator